MLERAASNGMMQRQCSDRSGIPVRPVVAGKTGDETNERRPGRTRRDRRTQGCFRVGRPPRTPLIDVETKEEHQIVDGNKLGQNKSKKIKVFVFDRLDTLIGRDPLYL